jgi:nucleoside-diphosphate-sugar epimerase
MTQERPSHLPIVILGAGYTGRYLFSLLTQTGRSVLATSRNPLANLKFAPEHLRIRFALGNPAEWSNLPARADMVWCFPAQPVESVKQFAEYIEPRVRRLLVLGSTSAYDVAHTPTDYPPPWLDETAPIDLTKPRVQGEELLRREYGAILLRAAGIYGPGRNPLDWIRTGRVGPSRKFVNLIHVEDLAAVSLAALERGVSGEAYNVSDGTPRTWDGICRAALECWGVTARAVQGNQRPGKRIAIKKLRDEIGYQFRHPDLVAALAQLTVPSKLA